MSSHSKCQSKSCANDDLDIISDLPLELKQLILTHLPIQENVRTSVLSSTWRHSWTSVSELVLDQQSLFKEESDAASEQFIHIVDKVLSQHKALPISVFNLSATKFCENSLNRWIKELLKHPVEIFYIKSFGGPNYNVSPELCMLHKLKELRLINCTINLPDLFRGFKALKSLSLIYCTLKEDELEKLVSTCPNLEMLALCGFSSMISVNIHSEKLKKLKIIGDFKKIHLITPCLIETCIISNRVRTKSNNVDLFDCFHHAVQSANLHFKVYKNLEKTLPERLNNLKSLFIMVNFGDKNKSASALYLLKNAPNLKVLTLYVKADVNHDLRDAMVKFWESATLSFEHLRSVKVYAARGPLCSKPALAFMKVLLGCASRLKNVLSSSIKDPTGQLQFANRLQEFKRASEKCVISVMKGPGGENSICSQV